jgi:hypothetical protein
MSGRKIDFQYIDQNEKKMSAKVLHHSGKIRPAQLAAGITKHMEVVAQKY